MKIKMSMLLFLLLTSVIKAELNWQSVGAVESVSIVKQGVIELSATRPAVAGILSDAINIPADADAILVEADVSEADVHFLTMTVHDAEIGETLGYWQNPLPIKTETHIATVLPLSSGSSQIRLFLGTHNQPSKAKIRNIKWKPLHRSYRYQNGIYGALIDGQWSKRQTFKATGKELGAVVFPIRQRRGYQEDGPGLAVRLYQWQNNMANSISKDPLAETIIPRGQIPGTLEGVTEHLDLAATYISGSRKLSVPLSVPIESEKTYIIELAVDGECEPDQGFISWCWLDGYPDGQLFDNNSTRGRNLDLKLEIYNAVH